MRAFVIYLPDNPYSVEVADRCIASAKKFGLTVEKFAGVNKENAVDEMYKSGLNWTWANNNTEHTVCNYTGLKQFPYTAADFRAKIGCSMSHYRLWEKCVALNEDLLILEHDAVFLRSVPNVDFDGICQINDPAGATRRGKWWSDSMHARGKTGVFEKTWVTTEKERDIPDGLAGNSAYLIKPWAAQKLIDTCGVIGLWPNDAIMCKQIFPYLEEYYPFITKVVQTKSTTVS